MAMFINPNDPNRNKPLVQTYDPVAGTSTGLKPYTAKPAVSSNPVPSPAPSPTPRPSPTARPTKVVGRNPVNTTPKFKSELYDKTVEAKKLSVVNPVTNPEKFTSAERGSLAFHMPDYLDRFKAVVENVKAGKATLPTVKQVKRAELIRFRDGEDYMTARDILSASTEEDERRYGLIKQARSVQSTIGMADDTEFPRIAKTLYEITNELDGRTDAPAWSDDYLKNPSLMQTMDDMLSIYEGQYAPLAYAEGVVEKGEKLKKDADWFDNLDTPYQAMDVQERKLYQQNIAFEYAQGKKPIMFDLPDEYLKAEQENIDLNGLTEIAPGQSLPQFMVIADKNEQEVREQASILEDILATDHGTLGDKARKNIEFDLDSLNDQLTAIDGFRYRYENANIKADAAEGEKAWRVDMKPYAVSTSKDYESMFAFEDRWAKKLAENPNNKALIAQKEQEQIKLGATINRDKAGREILGYEDQYSDYYLVPVMTDQERATYMSYYKTDKAKAHEYAMALDQTLNKRASFELSELTKKLASGTIWEQGLSAVGSVLTTVMKGISAIGIITKGITNQKIDPYAAYMEPAIVQQDIRGQLKKNTETAFGKDSIPTKSINLIGDILFGASDTIVGGKTLGFAGYMISGGSDSARDALLRGGNQDQALALMAANVAAEAITEAIPFDAIMGGFQKGFTWRGLFTSGFGEFVGEGASSLLGSEADKAIMLEKSYYETDVKEIEREKKISREEAEKIANKNILKDALYEGIVGLGSGDLAYMVSTRGRRAPKDTSAENAEVAKALDDADLGAAITGIITEYDAGENAPEAEQTEGQNPTTALEEQAAIDEASHEPDHAPQRPETPAQQPISEQGAGETRAEDNQIAPQTAREYEDNDEVKAARAAYEAATAKVNEAIANGVLKPDAEWAAQDAAYQALNDAIDRQGQARIADEQARNPILNPAAEQTEVSSEPVQPADTSLVDALSKEYPVQTIPVEGIKVSPQEYQFKANVDETGVKDKIEGNYIPSYAGTVVVHERADGTRYIADGHHRLSLAARSGIKELQAIVLREADGVTTAMARAFAAARNIASSRGTSIDAAKVFKETGITAEGLYALGLSPNEKNVSEGIALSQVDPQLFDRIAQDEIPLKAGVLIGQIFPNDGTMQREFLRKMAGRNLSYDAMTELANVLKNAREVAATQEQVGFDFLDDPALTNAAEIAEVAARVKNMLARTLSTFKGLSGGKKVDQVGAVGGNEIDTEANRAEANIALDAEIIMRTYWAADSPAFKLIDELAAQYAEGKLTLPKAAEQAYNAVSKIARDAINASKVDAAHGPAADSVAILIGAYGADQSRAFIGNALQAMNNTEYAIQQQTMRNIRDTMTLPIESTARQILDHMITGGKVDAGVLGSFNVAAQQDLSNPIYNDARSNSADESAIANQTAKDIQAGAMQGFDERQALVNGLNDKANALQEKADEANAKYDQAKKAISALNDQSMQPDFVIDESFKKNRTDLQRKQTAAKKSLDKAVEQAQTARKTADDAKAKFDADYAAQLTAIREKAIVSSQKAPNEQGAPLIPVDDTIPVSEKERPKSPKKGQKQGTPFQAMYNVTTGGLPISAPTVDYSGPVQSAQTIFTKLGKAIGVPFNVNRRQYMRGLRNTTAGYFIPKSEVVHVKNAQDLTAASHEFGHWVDKRTRIGSHPAILRIVSQLMNDPVFSQNYTPQELNGEAVAEAMKVYMVNREQALAHLGKDFVAELEKGLSELGVLKEFDAARAALGRTIGASTFEQIKARIVSADESGKRTVKERIRNIRAKTFDSTLVFDEMSKMLRGLRGNNYMMSEDPRMIALKNNRIDNFVKAIIEDRLVNVRGDTILGRGFADNFEGISANEIKSFEAYLIAYHDLDRTKVGKSALGGEFTRQQILSTIAEVEAAHPGWKNNKAMLHEWYDAFFKEYIVKQGVIAQGEYDNMKAMYPNYVPTYRQMGDDAKGAPNKSSGDVKKGLLGAKESDLNIINPIESMARLIMTYTQQAHRLQLGNVFADAIDRYDATGVFAENIQKDMKYRPEIAAIKSEIEQMITQQEEARQTTLFDSPLGENPDLEKFDQNVLSLLDRSMFTMENTATGANVINVLGRDGRYRSYLVHDANMLSVLQSVPSVQLTKVLQWTKNIVGMISATATGTNPFFALTNGVRDMATQMIYGTTSTNVLTAVPKWILNLPRTIAGILSNTTINGHQVLKDNRYTDAYRLYSMFSETGARYSAQIGKTSQTMVEALTSPNAAKKAGKAALKVFTMQFLNEMVENNSRFLEFYSGKSSLGKNRDNLNTFEGRLRAGLAASGVTVDFRRSGASPIMREIGAIVPFFNAGIQGINKAASLFTNENTGRRGQIAAKIVLNMTMLGVLQAVMNNMHLTDDEKEEYETFDEGYKAKSLFLKVGPEKLLRIPMTQDPISLIFYALGRAVGGAATGEGTSVADALVNGAKAVLTESTNFSTIYSPIQNLIENKTWYGSAIESSMMKGYARTERYNERTTGIAKWLSEKTGFLSPVQWDYIIPQYTGVWGKLGLNFVRNATGDATVGEALLETLNKEVSSRMFTTPAYTSQLYNNYKASLDGITQVKNHYRDNRPFSMFDPNLTQDELNLAVTEAHRMTKKGGELYDISEQISAKWDAYNQVISNASLTDEQRDQGTIAVRQEINQLSLKGQNIIAGYESKYFPGAVRTNERVIGFNVREMTAQGVKEASSMTQTVYDDLQSGKPYAKDYADYSKGIYEKWGSEYILTTKPSKTWKGFNESTASPEKLAAIDRVYFTVVANGLKAQNQAILNAKSAEEADKLIKAITRKAADAAKEEALR